MICKFCLFEGNKEDLCSPCYCDGSQKYVHANCLIKYLLINNKTQCPTCKYPFIEKQKKK